ncbi:MAG: O-antigen ligase family protein [Gammaproteobacteria bacterium]
MQSILVDKRADSFLFCSFLVLLFWLPLPFGSNRPWAGAIMAVWVFFLCGAWCWLYFRGEVSFSGALHSARFVCGLFLFWLLYILFQSIPVPVHWGEWLSPMAVTHWQLLNPSAQHITLSVDPHSSRAGLFLSMSYVLIFFLALVLVRSHSRLRQLAYVLVWSAVLQAFYGSLMSLSGLEYGFFIKKYAYLGVATGTFINRNHLAGYLEMGLAVGIGLLIASPGSAMAVTWRQRLRDIFQLLLSPKARLRLYLVIMVVALVLTHSRMGNTAFFTSLLVAGAIGLIFSRHASHSMVILLISLVLVDILIVGSWFGLEKVKQRIQQTSLVTESRDEAYADTLDLWSEYPLTGSGLGSFYAALPKYRAGNYQGFYNHVHNDYLEFLAESGVIGIAVPGLIVMMSFIMALMAQYQRRDPLLRGMSFAGIMGITAILIHSAVDFNLQIPANAATFVILLALCWISYGYRVTGHRR